VPSNSSSFVDGERRQHRCRWPRCGHIGNGEDPPVADEHQTSPADYTVAMAIEHVTESIGSLFHNQVPRTFTGMLH
jgi:hypothetical protein